MLPSRLLDNAVNQFARLPGVGKKTALRLVLYMLRQDNEFMDELAKRLGKHYGLNDIREAL